MLNSKGDEFECTWVTHSLCFDILVCYFSLHQQLEFRGGNVAQDNGSQIVRAEV